VVQAIAKLQQYTFVCAPSMAQAACAAAFDVDMQGMVERYRRRRDMVVEAFRDCCGPIDPQGAFYAFVGVPERLRCTASEFAERAIARGVLIIPGSVFSRRDTHFRLSYAVAEEKLEAGLRVLAELLDQRPQAATGPRR
jgi:aspartate/methionine/tyrosine aminotransferase